MNEAGRIILNMKSVVGGRCISTTCQLLTCQFVDTTGSPHAQTNYLQRGLLRNDDARGPGLFLSFRITCNKCLYVWMCVKVFAFVVRTGLSTSQWGSWGCVKKTHYMLHSWGPSLDGGRNCS